MNFYQPLTESEKSPSSISFRIKCSHKVEFKPKQFCSLSTTVMFVGDSLVKSADV